MCTYGVSIPFCREKFESLLSRSWSCIPQSFLIAGKEGWIHHREFEICFLSNSLCHIPIRHACTWNSWEIQTRKALLWKLWYTLSFDPSFQVATRISHEKLQLCRGDLSRGSEFLCFVVSIDGFPMMKVPPIDLRYLIVIRWMDNVLATSKNWEIGNTSRSPPLSISREYFNTYIYICSDWKRQRACNNCQWSNVYSIHTIFIKQNNLGVVKYL